MTILESFPSFTPPTGNYSGILPDMTIPITEEDLAEANKWFTEIFRKNSKFTNIHLAMVLANYRSEKKAPLTVSQENDDVMLTQEDQQEIGSEESVLMTTLDRQHLFKSGIRSERNRKAREKKSDPPIERLREIAALWHRAHYGLAGEFGVRNILEGNLDEKRTIDLVRRLLTDPDNVHLE